MEEYLMVLKLIGLLVLVALFAYLIIRFGLRRFQPSMGRNLVQIIQKVPLDVKGDRLLILVQIGERILLLGSAQGSISVLSEFLSGELLPLSEDLEQQEDGTLFARLLTALRERKKTEKEGN